MEARGASGMLPDPPPKEAAEEMVMKHCLLVAFLVLAGAACEDHPKGAAGDASVEPDAAALPDTLAREDMSPDVQSSPDLAPDAGADAETQPEAGPDAGADAGSDLGIDLGADTSPDVLAAVDAGVTRCGAAPREMLCTSYCDGVGRFCAGASMQYRTADECEAACNGSAWSCGQPGETSGNTLYCRLAHLTLAGLGSAATVCPNAGPKSATCQ